MNLVDDLLERLVREIDRREFTPGEWAGFKIEPGIALVAGAAIGYRLAADDLGATVEEIAASAERERGKEKAPCQVS